MEQRYKLFIEHLLKPLTANVKKFVEEGSKLLGVSESTMYSKLSGRSRFATEEVIVLADRFNLSLDEALYSESTKARPLPFYADGLKYSPRSFEEYFATMYKHFSHIRSVSQEWEAIYISSDVPIFYYLHFPHLMYMKLYVWNMTTWRIPGITQYDPLTWLNNKELTRVCQEILRLFNHSPTKEIWTSEMIMRSISQFNYLIQIGVITDEYQIKKLKDDFEHLVDYLEKMTVAGKRIHQNVVLDTDVTVYLNPLVKTTDFISLSSGDDAVLYFMYDSPNFVNSRNPKMTTYIKEWVDNLLQFSTCISKTGGFQQIAFFNDLRTQLKLLK